MARRRSILRLSRRSVASLAFLVLAGVIYWGAQGKAMPDAASEEQQDAAASRAKVVVTQVRKTERDLSVRLPARVVAYREAEIRPQVTGIIESRLFKEGSYVEKGTQLFQIDPERFDADLQMANAQVQTARAELRRATQLAGRNRKLVAANAVSQQEVDNSQAQLQQARAALASARAEQRMAQINLNYTKVYAPISGYISPTRATEGALVEQLQGEPLATIRQLDPIYIDLVQPGSNAMQIKQQFIERAESEPKRFAVTLFHPGGGKAYEETGYLDATDQVVDADTGSIRLRSVVNNPDTILLPGMFVEARIAGLDTRQVITIPQRTVTIEPDGSKSVWLVNAQDKAEKRRIVADMVIDQQWVVREGLNNGDRLVVEGAMNLRNNADVEITTLDKHDNAASQAASNQRAARAHQARM